MRHSIKKLPKGLVEIFFSVSPDEYQPYLLGAAKHLSAEKLIEGFRPGKAPYGVIKSRFGEARLMEAALPAIIKHFYAETVAKEKLETIGEPEISVTKMAPGDTLEYKLTVAGLPEVNLGAWQKIRVAKKDAVVSQAEIDQAIQDLRKMQTKETVLAGPAAKNDKVVVNMDMSRGSVPLEDGAARKHAIYLGEKYYIPGLAEKLLGIKAGETRDFSLEFPKEHYQKNIAGQMIDFKIKALDVYALALPELDDAFAEKLGQKNLAELRSLIERNLRAEAEARAAQRAEIEALEKIIAASRFDDIPEVLINNEVNKMLSELEHGIAEQGLEFNQYLEQIKKTVADLKLEFAPEATKRVKSALIVRAVAAAENIEVGDQEVVDEVTKLINARKNDAEAQKEIASEEYAEYIKNFLKNRKTLKLIRKTVIR